MERARALLVVQSRGSRPGRLGRMLRSRGYALDLRCPNEGDALPAQVEGHAGVIVLGGPMSANDDHLPGVRAQLDWLPGVVRSTTPFLGVCLGAQLLARTLGARVAPHPQGLAEIGYFPLEPLPGTEPFFAGPMNAYQWHLEGFELPPGATLLARGERFPNQAYRFGRHAFGIQFHPEVTLGVMERWMHGAAHRLALPGAQQPGEQRAGQRRHDRAMRRWLDRFLDAWLDTDRRGDRRTAADEPG